MALDTRNKRSASISAGRAWMPTLPQADGVISDLDLAHVGFSYPYAFSEIFVAQGIVTLVLLASNPTIAFVVSQPTITFTGQV